jgi:hypothetical protein
MPADEDLVEARALAEGALRALAAGGHEGIAAEMLRRAAKLADDARREVWIDEVLAPEISIVLDDVLGIDDSTQLSDADLEAA